MPMTSLPKALIISDFPIFTATAERVLRGRYDVIAQRWTTFIAKPPAEADMTIVDVTTVSSDAALALLWQALPATRIIECSLNENEVRVYRPGRNGPVADSALPDLFSLAA